MSKKTSAGGEKTTIFKTRSLDNIKFPCRSRSLLNKGSDAPRQRIDVACQRCRRRKIRCSGDQGRPDGKCAHCVKANYPCEFISRLHSSIQISPLLISAAHYSLGTINPSQSCIHSMVPFPAVVSPTGHSNVNFQNFHDTTLWSNDLSHMTLMNNHSTNASTTIYTPDPYGPSETLAAAPYVSPYSRATPAYMGLHSYLTNDPSIDLWISENFYSPSHEPSSMVDTSTDLNTSDQYMMMSSNNLGLDLSLPFDLQTSQFWSSNTYSQCVWASDYTKETLFDSVPILSTSYDASSDSAWDSQSPITDLFPNHTIDGSTLDGMFCFIKDLSPTPILQEDNSTMI